MIVLYCKGIIGTRSKARSYCSLTVYHYYRTLCAVFQGKRESFFVFFAGEKNCGAGGAARCHYSLSHGVGFNNFSVSRGSARAAPLPTHLLRICAGALKRRALCAVSKFAGGKKPTGLFARKRLLTPQEGAYNMEKAAPKGAARIEFPVFYLPTHQRALPSEEVAVKQ